MKYYSILTFNIVLCHKSKTYQKKYIEKSNQNYRKKTSLPQFISVFVDQNQPVDCFQCLVDNAY